MKNPLSTYRLQFNKEFTFDDFERVKIYFKKLGLHTIYASPIFEAVPGSMHGYDVCDPNRINTEIGTEAQLFDISKWLKAEGMRWIQDIVPNHMAFHPKNGLLMDLLEKGPKSLYTHYFDSVFTSVAMSGKLMVPFLGEPFADALNAKKFTVKWNGKRLVLCYGDDSYPLQPSSYVFFLEKLNFQFLVLEVSILEGIVGKEEYAKKWKQILTSIQNAFEEPEIASELQLLLDAYNQQKRLISQTVCSQHYELCYWKETDKRINYRRFFTVNGLICVDMADESVFKNHHLLIKKMLDEEVFDGLRIDHIDGLFNPSDYLKQLRNLAGREIYIIAEKILEKGEEIPNAWPIQGNTGYDFLGMLNNLFTKESSRAVFDDFYKEIYHGKPIAEEELLKKQYILDNHLAGELENLYVFFEKLRLSNKVLDKENLKKAIGAFLINMPVYRFYGESFPLNQSEREALKAVFEKIKAGDISFRKEVDVLEEIFLKRNDDKKDIKNTAVASFFKRCMQFSGPLMAKGVEDTLMYTDFRFIGHNEVGDHPSSFGVSIDEFHRLMANRQNKSPLSLNTTSTHDTKRGEDARARLNVLTVLPTKWFHKVKQWQKINGEKRKELAIDLHEEYFIYQCLIAHYPIGGEENDGFDERLKAYLQKAFREGKQHSDWANVNSEFEENVVAYINYLLNPAYPFLADFKTFHQKIAHYGVYNSLAQLGLKFTAPGVPDVYQGGELWDFSFVDPDNRRKVDYNERLQQLETLKSFGIDDLMTDYASGKIKLWLTHQLFKLRQTESSILTQGDYIPLELKGKYKNNLIAFIRRIQNHTLLIVSVINSAEILESQNVVFAAIDWEDTHLVLPEHSEWFNILQQNEGHGKEVLIKDFSLKIPFAVFKLSGKDSRHAGVLMHISSLPSAFGIGDLGAEAFRFADFLKLSGQHYWQLLPIGPGASQYDISPYSTLCSMAASPLLISPELLKEDGYLQETDLENLVEVPSDKIDFKKVTELKTQILKKAFSNFRSSSGEDESFQKFIVDEKFWLQDYSLFIVLKRKFNQPWFNWPDEFRFRAPVVLTEFSATHREEILEEQWYQYIFHRQWRDLKNYCGKNYVHLIGDLPFYVDHDSSDVWANPSLFSLNADGSIDKMAGVPPDYFSLDGQLWGMPVYNWTAMKENGYKWWLARIRKNLSWFNLLRLDHFRAFYNYWKVKGTEKTTVNGEWDMGPGKDFLNQVKLEFPQMPFIAEDLGEVSDEVFKLRDAFGLPGMKVLQFAFGDDCSVSPHIPHRHSTNFVVYTGTHDNNTTKGWFKNDLTEEEKKRLSTYLGVAVDKDKVAESLIKTAYSSVAKIAIIPIQDILNLDEHYRTNIPGTSTDNWSFRISNHACDNELAKRLKSWATLYGRE